MKVLVNYVIQGDKDHRHESEIINIYSPPYTFSPEPPVPEVMKWADKKQTELIHGQKLVVLSMFKV